MAGQLQRITESWAARPPVADLPPNDPEVARWSQRHFASPGHVQGRCRVSLGQPVQVGGQFFSIGGTSDPALYAAAPLSGSNNGSPGTNGYIAQFAYWPILNINLNLNYAGYTKFNGASVKNYDGAQRNASDNNTVYLTLWVSL